MDDVVEKQWTKITVVNYEAIAIMKTFLVNEWMNVVLWSIDSFGHLARISV